MTEQTGDQKLRDSNGNLKLYMAIETAMAGPIDPALTGNRKSAGLSPSSGSAVVTDPVTQTTHVLNKCLRAAWYSVKGYPQDPQVRDLIGESRFRRICAAGDIISDDLIANPAKVAGVYAGDEISFYDPDNHLSGRCDVMTFLPGTMLEKCVVEVKSMGQFMETPMIKFGQKGFTRHEPRFKDLPQLMSYMQWWMQFGVNYGALYYCSRDFNSNMFIFEWANVPKGTIRPADDAYLRCYSNKGTWDMPWITWGQIKDRYDELKVHLHKNQMPPRDFQKQYSNTELLQLARNYGRGSQFVDCSATDSKSIQSKFASQLKKTKSKDPEEHAQYMQKGSFACRYCDYSQRCWSDLGNPTTPEVKPEEWELKKSPKAPVADALDMTTPRR